MRSTTSAPQWSNRLADVAWRVGVGPFAILLSTGASSVAGQAACSPSSPEVRVGEISGPSAFSDITDVAIDDSGRIYVLQQQNREIAVIDRDGTLRARLGRAGEGPGEFSSPRQIAWTRDSLWVLDYGTREVLVLDTLGREGRRIGPHPLAPPYLASGVLAVLEGDRRLVQAWVNDQSIATGEVQSLPLILVDPGSDDGRLVRELSVRSRVLWVRPPGSPRGGLFGLQPFGDFPLVAPDPRGRGFVVVSRAVPAADREPQPGVAVYGPDGGQRSLHRFAYERHPIPSGEVSEFVERTTRTLVALGTEMFSSESQVRAWIEDALYVPEWAPPVWSAIVATDQTIWLERERSRSGARRWETLAAGAATAICVPAGVDLKAFTDTHAYGVELGPADVPYLVAYRIPAGR